MGILFKDRFDVGQLLAKRLLEYKDVDGVVLAIPRGGVPIAYEVANYLELPLDIILTKKIVRPDNSELAIGAVSLNDRILEKYQSVSDEYIVKETNRLRQELKKKQALFLGNRE